MNRFLKNKGVRGKASLALKTDANASFIYSLAAHVPEQVCFWGVDSTSLYLEMGNENAYY